MQLDRPKRRQRPREHGQRGEQPADNITPQDPFASVPPPQPSFQPQSQQDPFRTQQPHPFGQAPAPGFSNASFGRPQQNSQQQDPFSSAPFTPPKTAPFNKSNQSFPNPAFSKPSTPPFHGFSTDASAAFRRTTGKESKPAAKFASGITFGPADQQQTDQQGDPFAPAPQHFGKPSFGKPAFGKPTFGKPAFKKPAFSHSEREENVVTDSGIEPSMDNDAFSGTPDSGGHEPRGKRRSTPRRTRGSRDRDLQAMHTDGDGDVDLGDDGGSEPSKRRGQSSRNQLLLTSIPIPLFSRAAIQRHFSSVQNVTVSHVSLRGSRRPDARRTALISFGNEHEAALALREANTFRGNPLRLSVYRQAAPEHVEESNELFFNYVPESLFSEEGVTDLFDSISSNGVVRVSLKEKPFYGSVKRTAIITFKSVAAAAMALKNLPLYKGRALTVSFRRTPAGASNVAPPAPEEPDEPVMHPAKSYGDEDGHGYDNGGEEMPSILKRIGKGPQQFKKGGKGVSRQPEVAQEYDHPEVETEDDYEQPTYDTGSRDDEEEESVTSKAAKMKAEMNRLRAAIEKKQKERSLMTKGDKARRESKLMVPKRRDASSADYDGSSGWRKVGEKVDIKNAMNFVGICMTMCPLKEFEERVIQRDISLFEKDDDGLPSFEKAVKKYRRSAAISEQPSPDEVRPPEVLLTTMNNLMKICDSADAKFADIHNFVRDRTRSLRQDFTLQGVRDESCIKIHEESVRFHILSEHRLFGTDPAIFSSKQNREQLDKCLISLREMYDLRRDNDLDTSPNEPEMQAYYMLTQMSDPKTCVQLCTGFSQDVRSSQPVQFALAVVRAASDFFGSFTRYFSLVRSAPYLMACLMHSRFSEVRVRALAIINSTHGSPPSRRDSIPISVLTRQLGFEDEEEAVRFCRTLGVTVQSNGTPSTGPGLLSIRTPSGGFDEANKTKWKASRADLLIESKARNLKTSDIILGKGRDDYKSDDFSKKSSGRLLKAKENKSMGVQSVKPQSLFPESSQADAIASGSIPKLSPSHFPLEPTEPSAAGFPKRQIQSLHPTQSESKPDEGKRKSDAAFSKPEPPSVPSIFPTLQKQKSDQTSSPKALSITPLRIPAGSQSVYPSSTLQPEAKPISSDPSSTQKIVTPIKRTRFIEPPIMTRKEDSNVEKPKVVLTEEITKEKGDDLGLKVPSTTTVEDDKRSAEKLRRAARLSALMSLLTNLIESSEVGLEEVRKTIAAVEAGKLKFPKAMEVWDDAKDILLSVSEKLERGLQALGRDASLQDDETLEDVRNIPDLREKIMFLSQEVVELRDQLDEMFSKALAVATTNVKESGLYHSGSGALLTSVPTPSDVRAGVVGAYLPDDEELPFDGLESPDTGSESHIAVTAVLATQLQKWQTIIAPLTSESEAGITQRWLRHRFATNPDIDTGSLSLHDAPETGSASHSVREIKKVSRIPYTADLVIMPCDISNTSNDLSSTWAALEQVLRKNRSIALSHNLPPPMVVVLYYCGSSDMPSWLTRDDSFGSFASFQTKMQEKGYVATFEKLELPRVSAFQGIQCKPFTDLMVNRIRSAGQDYAKLGAIPLKKNLRDHLVYLANKVLIDVLGSRFPVEDDNTFQECIHSINQSWREIALHLRHEEARWPKEMAVSRRLVDAFTAIELHLRLPALERVSSTNEYIREMAIYLGLAIPTSRQLEGAYWFSSALGHLMNRFVWRKLKDCPASMVYLPPEAETIVKQRNATSVAVYTDPVKSEKKEKVVQSRYLSRTLMKLGTKRRRDNDNNNDYEPRAHSMKRRLSFSMAEPVQEEMESFDAVPNRRQSLPASYGRRRMYEMLDSICREGQMFDEVLKSTMDALVAKRRRLENSEAVLAS